MKKYYLITLIALCLGLGFSSYAPSNPSDEWNLLSSEGGVEFYILNRSSKVDDMVNSIIKVKNTNTYEVHVSFIPAFACGGADAYNNKPKESTYVEGNHATSLHTFKVCKNGGQTKVKVENISIRKR